MIKTNKVLSIQDKGDYSMVTFQCRRCGGVFRGTKHDMYLQFTKNCDFCDVIFTGFSHVVILKAPERRKPSIFDFLRIFVDKSRFKYYINYNRLMIKLFAQSVTQSGFKVRVRLWRLISLSRRKTGQHS